MHALVMQAITNYMMLLHVDCRYRSVFVIVCRSCELNLAYKYNWVTTRCVL